MVSRGGRCANVLNRIDYDVDESVKWRGGTYRIIETSPFGVDDHIATLCGSWRISKLGDIGHLLHVRTVRPGAKNSTKDAPT